MSADTFRALPDALLFNQIFNCEEDNEIEFKAVQDSKQPTRSIFLYLNEYLNAFVNAHGGSIFFGITDNQVVKGLFLTQKERDEIRLAADQIVNNFVPQLDSQFVRVSFIPVSITEQQRQQFFPEFKCVAGAEYTVENSAGHTVSLARSVAVVQVLPGYSPVYFVNKARNVAYMRREGGNVRMSNELVQQRIAKGRGEGADTGPFVGRYGVVKRSLDFLAVPNGRAKVLVYYGLISVGKSTLVNYMRQRVVSDRRSRGRVPYIYYVDLKGSQTKHLPLVDALLTLIRSISPELNLGQLLADAGYQERRNADQPQPAEQSPFLNQASLQPHGPDGLTLQQMLFDSSQNASMLQQQLLNIYTNLINHMDEPILVLENAGNPEVAAQLVPVCNQDSLTLVTSRKLTGMDFYLAHGSNCDYLELNVPPLTDDEGAMLVLRYLPNNTLEDAIAISRLCSGLPQVIKVICQQAKHFGLSADQLISQLSKLTIDQRIREFSPQIYLLLQQLSKEQVKALSYLVLNYNFDDDYIQFIFSVDQRRCFEQLLELGLIDQLNDCYFINQVIREYSYQMVHRSEIQQIVGRFVEYYSRTFTHENYTSQQFIKHARNYETCMRICISQLADQREHIRAKGAALGSQMLSGSIAYSKFFSVSMIRLYDSLAAAVRSPPSAAQARKQGGGALDWQLWEGLFREN